MSEQPTKARGNRPHQVHGEPAPAALSGLVQTKQTETEHDEGERRSVVEPGLPGEGEAQPVATHHRPNTSVPQLHICFLFCLARPEDHARDRIHRVSHSHVPDVPIR